MAWIFLALCGAVALGITEFLTKKAYDHFDAWTLSWARNLFALPVFYGFLYSQGVPHVDATFWKLLLIAAPLELAIGILFFFAIKLTPLSLVLPFTTFTTIFVTLGAHFINHEPLMPIYIVAFVLILTGSYFIQENRSLKLKKVVNGKSELGIALMILTAMLFGVSVPIGQKMSSASSSYFYLVVNFTVFVSLLSPIFLSRTDTTLSELSLHGKQLILVGIFNGAFLSCIWLAMSHGHAGPVSAINNLSIVIAILLGGTLLKERGLRRRLLAGGTMIVGAILAALG